MEGHISENNSEQYVLSKNEKHIFIKLWIYTHDRKKKMHVSALVDSGATHSVISKKIAETLNLIPIRKETAYTASGELTGMVAELPIQFESSMYIDSVFALISEYENSLILGMDFLKGLDRVEFYKDGENHIFEFYYHH